MSGFVLLNTKRMGDLLLYLIYHTRSVKTISRIPYASSNCCAVLCKNPQRHRSRSEPHASETVKDSHRAGGPKGDPAGATTASRLFAMAWPAGDPLGPPLPRPLAGVFSPASQPAVSRFVAELLQRFISRRRLYHVEVFHPLRNCLLVLSCAGSLAAQSFNAPAGIRSAQRRPTGAILPGGRIIQPEGEQFLTGSGPF